MTASLTPALALAYLHELSLDVRAAVVLDPQGERLAGDEALFARARALFPSAAPGGAARDGALHLARTPDGGAIAALAGPLALGTVFEHDLATAAERLVTTRGDRPGTSDSPP